MNLAKFKQNFKRLIEVKVLLAETYVHKSYLSEKPRTETNDKRQENYNQKIKELLEEERHLIEYFDGY